MVGSRFFSAFTALILASAACAAPSNIVKPVSLEVFTPTVTSPAAGTVWTVGSSQVVAWDTTNLDDEGKQSVGTLLLGFTTPGDASGNEHLDIEHPLAHGFHLGDGNVTVTVPEVQPRDTYLVALIGDSGNVSPSFTIQNATA